MKQLQKSRIKYINGKEEGKEPVGEVKPIVDSVADNLIIDSDQKLKDFKRAHKEKVKANSQHIDRGVEIKDTITIWEEMAEKEEGMEALTVAELKELAAEKEIEGYKGMKKAELITALEEAEKEEE